LDGIETAERILKAEPYIQLIICSAYSDYSWADISRVLLDDKRWMILKKPYDIIEIKQIANAFSIKWTLERQLEEVVKKRTQNLESLNTELQEKITSLTSARKSIKYSDYYDKLTKLPNRRYFLELLNFTLQTIGDTNLGLINIDIDGFKHINHKYGYYKADKVLELLGARLASWLNLDDSSHRINQETGFFNGDHHLAYIGGNQFAILIKNFTNNEDLNNLAAKIHLLLNEPIKIDDLEIKFTCSIGITSYPEHSRDVESLLLSADKAMEQAKISGRNQIKFYAA